MSRRMTPLPSTGADRPDAAGGSGNTTTAQDQTQRPAPRMPHERDESADGQARMEPSSRRVGEQAHADVRRGVPDTSKGAELDATYEKLRQDQPPEGRKPRS